MSASLRDELLAAAGRRRELLQAIVDVARAIFRAEAASIALLEADGARFVFEAASGEGGEDLVGKGFPTGQGIAGAVAQSGEPMIVDDLSSDPRFARDVAERTGYVPSAMMVAPLLSEDDVLGVLSVLDRSATDRSALAELQLLGAFAAQAAIAVSVTDVAARAAETIGAGRGPDAKQRDALARLLAAADDLRG